MKISSFEWDSGNEEKLKKHQISVSTIEAFFIHGDFFIIDDLKHSTSELRYIAFGALQDESLFVAFTIRVKNGNLSIRVISARKLHERELRKLNEKIKS